MKHFRLSFLVTAACLAAAGWWGFSRGGINGALAAFGITAILAIMEVSLSFDNAVVNASVLKTWTLFWQNLFLGLGIIIAVFGMRLLFPLVIVAAAADLGIVEVWRMALNDPRQYSTHLTDHHAEVAAFGGVFLLLVFLNFVIDEDKELHWLGPIEQQLGALGKAGAVPVLIALGAVLGTLAIVEPARQLVVLIAGIWGIVIYVAVDVLSNLLEKEDEEAGPDVGELVKRGGIGAFLYLEVLDASFSFDGVIGAFAITNDVIIIMLGLAVGAMFVRSMTVYLVRQGTLDEFVYLEHGAHYAIGILALIMLASIKYHVSEIFTGLIGVAFIAASLWSSHVYKKRAGAGDAAAAAQPAP